jgi:hypothetical protein
MSAVPNPSEHSAPDPWTPPPADTPWFDDPAKRQNYITHLERHNEALFLEAIGFLHMWKGEDEADARPAEVAA